MVGPLLFFPFMRYLYILPAVIALILFCGCMEKPVAVTRQKAYIEFDTLEYDFGNVDPDGVATHEFVFHNTGSTPLVVQDVLTFCSCIVADWDKKPVEPGYSGKVYVKYTANSINSGFFHKTALVQHNGSNLDRVILHVKGNVSK